MEEIMEGKNKKATRTVTEKIEGAEKGHLGDMFEVAGWMESGRYSLNTDKAKAQEYYDHINENLQTKRPFFSSLELLEKR